MPIHETRYYIVQCLWKGEWSEYGSTSSLEDALCLAASIIRQPCVHVSQVRDNAVRIICPDGSIL